MIRRITAIALGILAASAAAQNPDLGRPTFTVPIDPAKLTDRESTNRANELVNAPVAWSRGWTGLGSGILIMDTGIDVNHPDFRNRVRATLDLSARGITDRVGHGTHVAGVAAGARNGLGSNGVAFDSHLYVAKLADNQAITGLRARQALIWAQQFPDIRAANFSANTQFNTTYTQAMQARGRGIYVSGDARYRGDTFYNSERPQDWAAALAPGMVLTVSAGNQNLPYPQNPASFAAATDAQGQLILRGQMLIVGNWNDRAGRIESARAGHVCRDMQGTQCRDPYRTWDFYILAPGMAVNSATPGGGSRTMSGSSQAAPVVAGAVAIIGQMWPYMPADQVVQLLLRTARRDLPGYDVTTHGQGLLDLDQATRPQGAVGLRTRGRTTGRQMLTGTMGVSGVMTPSSMAVLDEYDRDFVMIMPATPEISSRWDQAVMPRDSTWATGVTGLTLTQHQGMAFAADRDDFALSWQQDLGRHWYVRTSLAQSRHDPTVQFSGSWGQMHHVLRLGQDLGWRHGAWQAEAGVIHSRVRFDPGLISQISPIQSLHARLQYHAGAVTLETGVLPRVIQGQISFDIPDHMDAQGQMQYRQENHEIREPWVSYWAMSSELWSTESSQVSAQYRGDRLGRHRVDLRGQWQW